MLNKKNNLKKFFILISSIFIFGVYNISLANSYFGSIGNLVWNDVNRNGFQDVGEKGIPGVRVHLFKYGSQTTIANTTTNSKGEYIFKNLAPGDYYLEFITPKGYVHTQKNRDSFVPLNDTSDSDVDSITNYTDIIKINPGKNDMSWDAGYYRPISNANIIDFVWEDTNRNGIQDKWEIGTPGIRVNLFTYDDQISFVGTTITDVDGSFVFENLTPAKEYYIDIVDDYMIYHTGKGYRWWMCDETKCW